MKNIALGVSVVLVLAFGSLAAIEQNDQRTTTVTAAATVTSTSTFTTTATSSSSVGTITTHSGPAGRVSLYRISDGWNFSVTLSGLVVPASQVIEANFTLTNISGKGQIVWEANPLIDPVIYSEQGMPVWASYAFAFNSGANFTAPGNQQESNGYKIPTSTLDAGQSYVLSMWPLIDLTTGAPSNPEYLLGRSLMINATISITDAEN